MPFESTMNPDPLIVWHYCSSEAFGSIVEEGRLRRSDPRFTNDPMEIAYARGLVDRVVRKQLPVAVAEQVLKGLKESLPLVACFSAEDDLLSQWRAYADDGRGFAIGVLVNSLDLRSADLSSVFRS